MKGEPCEKYVSTDGEMKLVLCGCDKLHVTVGLTTLHFTRDEFQIFAETIRRLAAIVAQPSFGKTSLMPRSSPSEVSH
jgi:hypothetical protein